MARTAAGVRDEQIAQEQFVRELLLRVDGDRELADRMAQLFLEMMPTMLGQIHETLARGEAEAAARIAHSFKGSAANFPAGAVVAEALRVEKLARAGKVAQARVAVKALDEEVERLKSHLQALLDAGVKP
jgi:HPt (histidine-containing phosphotransfer) domain-containing protein